MFRRGTMGYFSVGWEAFVWGIGAAAGPTMVVSVLRPTASPDELATLVGVPIGVITVLLLAFRVLAREAKVDVVLKDGSRVSARRPASLYHIFIRGSIMAALGLLLSTPVFTALGLGWAAAWSGAIGAFCGLFGVVAARKEFSKMDANDLAGASELPRLRLAFLAAFAGVPNYLPRFDGNYRQGREPDRELLGRILPALSGQKSSREDPQEDHGVVGFKRHRITMSDMEEEKVQLGAITETESLADIATNAAPWKPLSEDTPRPVPEAQTSASPARHRTMNIFFLVLLLMSFAGLGIFLLVHRVPEGSTEMARSIAAILEVFVAGALVALHLRR
jgi:hypothetical protein